MQHTKVAGYDIYFENEREFKALRREVFDRNTYYVEIDRDKPLIYDIGAHIGLASLYFARLFPQATIVAVEPNPENLKFLEMNIHMNRLEDRIKIIPYAISDQSGFADFFMDGSPDAWHSNGRLAPDAWDGTKQNKVIEVQTCKLVDLITPEIRKIDLVKMDIEGSEHKVLEASKSILTRINHILLEHHPVDGNSINDTYELLSEVGFDVHVFKKGREIRPFRSRGLVMMEGKR